jgi:hypothetical protein
VILAPILVLALGAVPATQERGLVSFRCPSGKGQQFLVISFSNPDEIQFARPFAPPAPGPLLSIGPKTGGTVTRVKGNNGSAAINASGQAGGHRYAMRLTYKPVGEYDGVWSIAGTEDGVAFGGQCEQVVLMQAPGQ